MAQTQNEKNHVFTISIGGLIAVILAVVLLGVVLVEEGRLLMLKREMLMERRCCTQTTSVAVTAGKLTSFCEFSLKSTFERLGIIQPEGRVVEDGIGDGL